MTELPYPGSGRTRPLPADTLSSNMAGVLLFATRYARGRQTGAAFVTLLALKEVWHKLDHYARQQLWRESFEPSETPEDWEEFRKFVTEFELAQT